MEKNNLHIELATSKILGSKAKTLFKNLKKSGDFSLKSIPKNEIGDELFSYILFKKRHEREPSNTNLFLDFMYQLKVSKELESPIRQFITDKEYLKIFVRGTIGNKFNVPTNGILKTIKDIAEFEFPKKCVIKPTHYSGEVIIRDKEQPLELKRINDWLAKNYYDVLRERNYLNLQPKIIIEPLLFDNPNLIDYKIFCFNGKPKLISVDVNRFSNKRRRAIYDLNWNKLDFSISEEKYEFPLVKPENLKLMLCVAEKLSAHFSFIRVDLFSDGKNCKVGELTNLHGAGISKFIPTTGEKIFSEILFS